MSMATQGSVKRRKVNPTPERSAKRTKVNASKQQDRLSYLPDVILVNILSLLPIHSAIATTVLSRQWLNLWTLVMAINIDIDTIKSPFNYWTSLHKHVLTQLTSPHIHKITFNLNCGDLGKKQLSTINSWFRKIAGCWNIDEIYVTSNGQEGNDYFSEIFRVKSLEILEIIGGFGWKMPRIKLNSLVVNLPNLKKLTLQLDVTQHNFVRKLISSCTLLECLSLSFGNLGDCGHMGPAFIELPCPSLRRLSLAFPCDSHNGTTDITVDAPNLDYFKLDSHSRYYPWKVGFVHELSRLAEVDFSGGATRGHLGPNLMKAIMNARTLSLSSCLDQFGEETIKFGSLTRLRCTVPCSEKGFRKLLGLLERCPVLECLSISFMPDLISDKKMSSLMFLAYCSTSTFALKLDHVKVLEINFMSLQLLDKDALNFIKLLVNIVHVGLERLIFKASGDVAEAEAWRKGDAYTEFIEWVNRYKNSQCKVELLGRYLNMNTS